ncbi:MAG: type II toxin-antitoxin system VapC family toxin [Chloroflexi bacterium]|nr:type II toxin-antitoxin system VapC family toxin [Chloroflexota bacterium]
MVFADTEYFVALISKSDKHHEDAVTYADLIEQDRTVVLITTDAVLAEVLNWFARRGESSRSAAVSLVRLLLSSPASRVEPQTRDVLNDAIGLYADRPDKDWSLTDCISLVIMDRLKIDEALAFDHAFVQAGKRALLRGDQA